MKSFVRAACAALVLFFASKANAQVSPQWQCESSPTGAVSRVNVVGGCCSYASGIYTITCGGGGGGVSSLTGGQGITVNHATGAITLGSSGGGDVTGPYSANTVTKFQNRAFSSTAPSNTNTICWNAGGNTWQPCAAGGGGSGTVTSVTCGAGLLCTAANPIVASGTITPDSSVLAFLGAPTQTFTSVKTFASGADPVFAKEADHTLTVVASTTAAAAGGNLTCVGGAGAAASGSAAGGTGGSSNLTGGNGGAATGAQGGGQGGSPTITAGNGGAATATGVGGHGGNIRLAAGIPGTNAAGGTGSGGAISLVAGNGANAVAGARGTPGGSLSFTAGVSGNGSASFDGADGNNIQFLSGTGGNGGAGHIAGVGGEIIFSGGDAGATGGGTGNNGGSITLDGGAKSGAGVDGSILLGTVQGAVTIGKSSTIVDIHSDIALLTGKAFAIGANTVMQNDKLYGNNMAFTNQQIGDLFYADTTTTMVRLAIGTNGQTLVVSSGLPAWGASSSGNATQLQGRNVSAAAPSNLDALCWVTAASDWEPCGSNIPVPSGAGKMLYDTGTTYAATAVGTTTQVLHGATGAPTWSAVVLTTDVSGLLPLANAGWSGATAHAPYVGNGAAAPTSLGVGTNGQVVIGSTGADPAWGTIASTNLSVVGSAGGLTINAFTGPQLASGGTLVHGGTSGNTDLTIYTTGGSVGAGGFVVYSIICKVTQLMVSSDHTGTTALTIGATAGANQYMLSQSITDGTAVGTTYGWGAQKGASFASSTDFNAVLGNSAPLVVRAASSGTIGTEAQLRCQVYGGPTT